MTARKSAKTPPFSTISNPKALAAALKNAATFASDDEMRPVLCCVQITADGDKLQIVACDSYLLLVQELIVGREPRMDQPVGRDRWQALVHRGSLRLMGALLQGVKEEQADLECRRLAESSDDGVSVLQTVGPWMTIEQMQQLAAEAEGEAPTELANAGELVLRVGESELLLPLYEHGVYPNWQALLDKDVAEIDGAAFGAKVIKRLGSIALPSGDDARLDWTFTGEQSPVLFKIGNADEDMKARGAFMPQRDS